MSIEENTLRLELERRYTPGELVEVLNIPMEKLLDYIMEEVYNNIEIFEEDLIVEEIFDNEKS